MSKEQFNDSSYIDSLIKVSQELHLTMTLNELVNLFLNVFDELLPGRQFCFRLLKNNNSELELIYSNGKLKYDKRNIFYITDDIIDRQELSKEQLSLIYKSGVIEKRDSYESIFLNSNSGFNFLLCDRKNLYGVVDVACEDDCQTLEDKITTIFPFIHLLVAALRNTRLMTETLILKEYWEKLLDHANAAVIVTDREGKILLSNKTFERLTLMPREEIISKDLVSLVSIDRQLTSKPQIKSALNGEPLTNMEMCFSIDKFNEEFAHIAFNSAPIMNSFGVMESVIFVGQDLTTVRQLQRQIIHSEKLATLGQVAAGVAHELNNPLTSISVYAEFLKSKLKDKIDPQDIQKIESILDGAKRIQSFTKDLVSYARPSIDKPELVNIIKTVERSVSFCEHLIHKTGADVSIESNESIPEFYGVEGQIEQVFVNLVTNACHSLEDGGKIVLKIDVTDNSLIVVSVRDEGVGIEKKYLKKIFEPFYSTKKVGKGTGLGLSIVKNILNNHNASITVDSDLGTGTVFVVNFKAHKKTKY